jgi:hypothetical protein
MNDATPLPPQYWWLRLLASRWRLKQTVTSCPHAGCWCTFSSFLSAVPLLQNDWSIPSLGELAFIHNPRGVWKSVGHGLLHRYVQGLLCFSNGENRSTAAAAAAPERACFGSGARNQSMIPRFLGTASSRVAPADSGPSPGYPWVAFQPRLAAGYAVDPDQHRSI